MRVSHAFCAFVLALALGGCGLVEVVTSRHELVLAANGEALLPIVISPEASAGTKSVAAELAGYLKQVSGAEFEVTSGDGARGIVLGAIQEFPQLERPEIARALEIRNGFDGKEAYAIRTERERLLLLGATELGASHAAFRLLEEFGCRWFFPAKEWETVPAVPTLRVRLNLDDRPAFLSRRIWYQWGYFEHNVGKCAADYSAWARHNRMGASLKVHCGHAWDSIIAQHRKDFDEHPEYLALHVTRDDETGQIVKQERGGNKFCISNPGVVEICKRYALDYFAAQPEADMISVDPSDGGGHCECEQCAQMGGVPERVFYLANEVAKAVAEDYPGKMVGLYAYNFHSEPPSFELAPNVYVQLTGGFIRGRYSYGELLEMWPKKCRMMGFYEYFSVYQWNRDMLPGGNGANVRYMRTKIPDLYAHNATSLDAESGDNWGLHGRGYIVANRLMWDPQADVDAILEDFYTKAFGPAAEPMRRYYERLDPGNEPLMSEHLVGLAFRDVAEATRLAAGHPDVLARLDHVKIYLRYFHLRWTHDRTQDKEEQKRLVQEIFTHVYRTRYTYMNHWEAIRQFWTPRAAKQYEEPSWSMSGPEAPWIGTPPYTREQVEAFFREGLEHFQVQDIEERSFSGDLAPVDFGEVEPGICGDRGQWQGGFRHALYSIAGEPLAVSVIPGTIAWYRDRPDATYAFSDAAGKAVAEGRLPLDGEAHALQVEVPAPGLYYLDFNDSGAGWRILAERDRPLAIPLRRGGGLLHHGWNDDLYFYVPKGTREVQYYWQGGAHNVYGPDGKRVQQVTESGKFIKIPVPEDGDGRVWRMGEIALGHLWFFNVPNYVARSPGALLVPREAVAADGLAIRQGN